MKAVSAAAAWVRFFILVAAIGILAACSTGPDATTTISSYIDRERVASNGYDSTVVFVDGLKLNGRQKWETKVVGILGENGIIAHRGMDVVPPTRQGVISSEKWMSMVVATGAKSLLIIEVENYETNERYTTPTYIPGRVSGYTDSFGNIQIEQTPGYTIGGHTTSRPTVFYSAEVYDLRHFQPVWVADIVSRGGNLTLFRELDALTAQETIAKLISEGILNARTAK